MRQTLKYARQRKIRGYPVHWEYDHKKLRDFKEGRINSLGKYSTGRAGVYVRGMPVFYAGSI